MRSPADLFLSGEWIPYRVEWKDDLPEFQWLFVGSKRFTEPFFEETLLACRSFPENEIMLASSGDELLEAAGKVGQVLPTVVIFHVSRCGSTLLTQLLTTDEPNTVLSEVPLLDELLMYCRAGRQDAIRYYRAAVTMMGNRQTAKAQRIFIKSDSWHLAHYNTLRSLYPQSLFVFLIREPEAIVSSHNQQAGIQAVKGTRISDLLFSKEQLKNIDPTEYLSCVLTEYYRMIRSVSAGDENCKLYDYSDGILQLVELIYSKQNFPFTEAIRSQMSERMKFHSKRNQVTFTEDKFLSAHLRMHPETISSYRQTLKLTEHD